MTFGQTWTSKHTFFGLTLVQNELKVYKVYTSQQAYSECKTL